MPLLVQHTQKLIKINSTNGNIYLEYDINGLTFFVFFTTVGSILNSLGFHIFILHLFHSRELAINQNYSCLKIKIEARKSVCIIML